MSVRLVLLPVFVLVGLTFALLLGMATTRTRALKAGKPGSRNRAGRTELAGKGHPDRQLLQQPV